MNFVELYGFKKYDTYVFSEGLHHYQWFFRRQDQHPCHYDSILRVTKDEIKNCVDICQQIESWKLSNMIYHSAIYENTQNIGECLQSFIEKYDIDEDFIYEDDPIKEPVT